MKVTKKMRARAPKLAAYWEKKNRKAKHGAAKPKRKKKAHHHNESHMAKSKKKKHGGKRRGGGSARRRSHRRHNHGGVRSSGIMNDLILAGTGLAFGMAETKMKTDQEFFLNKVPTPINALGRVGNITLGLYLASYLLPGNWKKYARTGAKVGAIITGYQLGRKGEAFKEGSETFVISGHGDGDERFIGDDDIGELADEMSGHNVRGSFDVVVDDDEDFHDIPADHHDHDPSGASTPGVLQPVSPT